MIDGFGDVLARARSGDGDALATLYRDLNPGLERYLRGRAPEMAEDLAAESWIAVAESIGRFSGGEADFRGWVFTIARNRAIDAHRRARRQPAAASPVDTDPVDVDPDGDGDGVFGDAVAEAAETVALDGFETETVLALVRRLPPDQADVILLRVVAGLDAAHVGAVLGKRPGTIRVLQHRGLRNLQRILGGAPDPESGP